MAISVPAEKRERPPLAPTGRYSGTVTYMTLATSEGPHRQAFHQIDWRCERDGDSWDLVQICEDDEDLADALVDLGLAGKKVEPDAAIGRSCIVEVAHFANRRYARVVGTHPPTAE